MRTRFTPWAAAAGIALLAEVATAQMKNPIVAGNARFTVIDPECIRLEYSSTAEFIDAPSLFAINRAAKFDGSTIRRDDAGTLTIDTGRMRLVYTPDGEQFSARNLRVEIEGGDRDITWTPASRQMANLGGTILTLDQIKGPVSLEEGIISRDGWYLLDDSSRYLLVDNWAEARPKTAGSDAYLFGYGSDYAAAFRAFTAIGGAVPMPRKAVLGSWYSRWWKYTTQDYKDIVREYAEHDFPLDIIVMDMEWHREGWTGWSWNRELLPDAEDLLKWFHKQGLTVTLNVHPSDGVEPHEDMYAEFMARMGADPKSGETIPFDAGNREYMKAYFDLTHHPREDEGVDFWWLDWQQYPDVLSKPGLLNLTWLNKLYFDDSMRGGKRGLQFSRWGQWGDHRHPIHFSGDADTGWAMLGFEVPFTSTAANEGAYFWSHDIGGHFGDRNEEPYTRWVQFASVTAAMRLHSGIIEYLDRRPWKWAPWATESMRGAFHLRAELMPYVYSSVWQTHRTSLPLTRPMYIQWPNESDAYLCPQQYMFGEAMLAAPIASAGFGEGRVASQLVWFPEGAWYNYFTSERIDGPEWRLVSADMNELPLYVRSGTPLPMQSYNARPASAPLDKLVIKLWPGESGASTLYEDDGISRAYETGGFATTRISWSGNELSIAGAEGSFGGQAASRAVRVEFMAMKRPKTLTINGEGVEPEYDEESGRVAVEIPAQSVRESIAIEIDAAPVDPGVFADKALQRRLRGIAGDETTSLAHAIEVAGNDTLPGLLALAGIGLVENETHYPKPGVLRRIVRNADSSITPDGARIVYIRETTGDAEDRRSELTFDNLSQITPFEAPHWLPHDLAFGETATIVRELTVTAAGKSHTMRKEIDKRSGELSEWLISKAYPFDPDISIAGQNYAPESMSVEELANIGAGGEWVSAKTNEKGILDIRKVRDLDYRIVYAVATIDMKEERDMVLGFRSDDGIMVWFNGELIHTANVSRGVGHDWENFAVHFNRGRNVLLLKISQFDFGWEFAVIGRDAKEVPTVELFRNKPKEDPESFE